MLEGEVLACMDVYICIFTSTPKYTTTDLCAVNMPITVLAIRSTATQLCMLPVKLDLAI